MTAKPRGFPPTNHPEHSRQLPSASSSRAFIPAMGFAGSLVIFAAIIRDWQLACVLVAAVALFWAAMRKAQGATQMWSPLHLYLPVYVAYNGVGLYLAHAHHRIELGLLLAAGAAAFLFGYLWRRPPLSRHPVPQPRYVADWPLAAILLSVGIVCSAVLIAKVGSVPLFADDTNAARVAYFDNGYLTTILITSAQPVVIAGLLTAFRRNLNWGTRAGGAGLALLGASLLVVTASRALLMLPVLIVLILLFWRRRPWPTVLVLVGAIAFVSFSVLGYYRDFAPQSPEAVAEVTAGTRFSEHSLFLAPALRYVQGTAETFDRTIEYWPTPHHYEMGRQFFSPLLLGESADVYLKRQFKMDFEGFGLALGAPNALYLDWGPLGVVVGMFAFGAISAVLYERARDRNGRWTIGYALWLTNLLLSNYGHPFAYVVTVAVPVMTLLVVRSAGMPVLLASARRTRPENLSGLVRWPWESVRNQRQMTRQS